MRRISRMLLPLAVWCFAVFGGAAAFAETAGAPGADAAAAAWTAADAELAVLSCLIAAQRADVWSAYTDAIARMHADAASMERRPRNGARGVVGGRAKFRSGRVVPHAFRLETVLG